MKNKSSKIIITILLISIIMLISSTSHAKRMDADGNGIDEWHYTADILRYDTSEGQIKLTDQYGNTRSFYCINHQRRTLRKGMADATKLNLNMSEELSERMDFAGFQNEAYVEGTFNSKVFILNLTLDKRKPSITNANKTATVDLNNGETMYARDAREAAIYGFSKEFKISTRETQDAIWNYENAIGKDCGASGNSPNLWRAANEYIDWANPEIEGNGAYKTGNNVPNLVIDSSEANVDFVYSDSKGMYMIGPLTVSYNQGGTYGNIRFTKDLIFEANKINNDGSEETISEIQITDERGNVKSEVYNGENFFIKFPYSGNENIEEIKLKSSVQYIAKVWGKSVTYKTTVHNWKYEAQDKKVTAWVTVNHAADCPKKDSKGNSWAGKQETIYVSKWMLKDNLSLCDGGCESKSNFYEELATYGLKVEKDFKLVRSSTQENYLQDMREIYGSVTWATANADEKTIKVSSGLMTIAGDVWEDVKTGKDSQYNGKLDSNDVDKDGKPTLLKGIEVRLYEQNGTLTTLQSVEGELSTNPALTDINGHYEFKGVNPSKKYYVVFTYDGMMYTNTYGAGKPEYNTDAWNATSKGSELINERNAFNTKFVTIGADPRGYRVDPNSVLFSDITYLTDGYNQVFNINDEDVLNYKAEIEDQLKTYLSTYRRLEDGKANYVNAIYRPILNRITNNEEKVKVARILQFIWDCRINSYGGYESVQDGKQNKNDEVYPYYNKIVLSDDQGNKVTANEEKNINGFWIIYNGQLHVNQGIIRRDFTDLELSEDLYRTVVSINGKDEIYKYGSLSKKQVNITSADFMSYDQNIANEDYNYKTDRGEINAAKYPSEDGTTYAPIQLYVTYRINVTNTSMIPTSIKEIATHFVGNYYSYSESYTTTEGKTLEGVEGKFIANDQEKSLSEYDDKDFGMKVRENITDDEDRCMYISFDNEIILHNNEGLALYITYRLGDGEVDSARNILQATLADDGSKLEIKTRAEINSFGTYYMKNSEVSTTQSKYKDYYGYASPIRNYDNYRPAGVLDSDSIPGNLNTGEIAKAYANSKIEDVDARRPIEDDWDDATTLVIKKATGERTLSGKVWEEIGKTEAEIAEASYYARYNNINNIEGITVELVEIKDGKEYIRARTTTNTDGTYSFNGYIPGEYVVRFKYGDKILSSDNSKITINNTEINRPYNGLFYQSTKANPNTNAHQFWYADDENEDVIRYSDAYDEVNRRKAVNESLQNYAYKYVTNTLSNAAGYEVYSYTSMLDIYPEKAKTETTGTQNPGYAISKIDFGLTPRSLNDLEIKKEVTHLKLILQNGMVQFDTDTATIREQGVPAVVQAAQGHDINVSMSSELVNGATLEITYTITVTNNTPNEEIIYYKDAAGKEIAVALYKEDAKNLVYYENDIRVHDITAAQTKLVPLASSETKVTTSKPVVIADFISNNLNFIKNDYTGKSVNQGWDVYTGNKDAFKDEYYNLAEGVTLGSISNMEATEVYNSNTIVLANSNNPLVRTDLKSGESVSSEIVLSKIISVNNDSSDTKSYNNTVRILKINSSTSKIQDMVGDKVRVTSEKVIISDPTGMSNKYIILGIALAVFAILGTGIILIKKFVISKR